MEKSNLELTRTFALSDKCSWYWKLLYMPLEEKVKHQPSYTLFTMLTCQHDMLVQ